MWGVHSAWLRWSRTAIVDNPTARVAAGSKSWEGPLPIVNDEGGDFFCRGGKERSAEVIETNSAHDESEYDAGEWC